LLGGMAFDLRAICCRLATVHHRYHFPLTDPPELAARHAADHPFGGSQAERQYYKPLAL
jgi:hypothetical protein